MRWLVLGATGLLGPAFVRAIRARGGTPVSAARSGATENFDIQDLAALRGALVRWKPDAVVNCAALADLSACEADPGQAWMVNARPIAVLAAWSRAENRRLIQVSTDQMMSGTGSLAQDEATAISFPNEYASTKYVAETFAQNAPRALVVRTNILGAMKGFGATTLSNLQERNPMTLFDDYYTSPIHIDEMANATLDLHEKNATGVFNVAGSSVVSKAEIALVLAARLGIECDWAHFGSAQSIKPPRNLGLGLDVTRAQNFLGRSLPGIDECVDSLANEAGL